MRQIVLLVLLLSNYYIAYTHGIIGKPLFYSISQIEYIANSTILEKIVINNFDTCLNGKIIKLPAQYIYKCRLIQNFYGNITDSILNLSFIEPQLEEYDDSCNLIGKYWFITSFSGIEDKLIVGDNVLLCFDSFHQIIAVRKTISNLDNFIINHFDNLKEIDKTICRGINIYAIGETKNSELCILKFFSKSSDEENIAEILVYKDNEFKKYYKRPKILLENIDSNILWKFTIKRQKFIICNSKNKYILPIISKNK